MWVKPNLGIKVYTLDLLYQKYSLGGKKKAAIFY